MANKNIALITGVTGQDGSFLSEFLLDKGYEQVPEGKYLIVGTLKTRVMSRGDNLYKFAKQELGDKNLVNYIIVHNKFQNPDKIPLGYDVKIPVLREKK